MEQNPPDNPADTDNIRNTSEEFRAVPHSSESFGSVLKDSAPFRNAPNDSESFRAIPDASERTENHTLTVREAARLFEAAGVARTERSIVNWCQPNRHGLSRLDSYFDPNERKYYLTPQSVERVIQEEIQRTKKSSELPTSEPFGKVPNGAEKAPPTVAKPSENTDIWKLENQIRDLQITNQVKDGVIKQMQEERKLFIEQVVMANRKVGELETKLLQLESRESDAN